MITNKLPLVLAVFCLIFMAETPLVYSAESNIRQPIIDRCRAQMSDMGATMVKFCVDEDLKAHKSLEGYDERYGPIIDRCQRDMLSVGGWTMVQFCADEDIEAERALEEY